MTAVEWLMDKYVDKNGSISYKDLQQAKEMEKQQIIDACNLINNKKKSAYKLTN